MNDLSPVTHQYALAALKERRSAVAGELAQLERQARIRRDALVHLDAVLRMFAPDLDPGTLPTKRPRRQLSGPDPFYRTVLDVLREGRKPLTKAEIDAAVAGRLGLSTEALGDRVRAALWHLVKKRGTVEKAGDGPFATWCVR